MNFDLWFMFPFAVAFSTTAMASGVGGATFFAPFLLLVLRLPPDVAVGTGLVIEVFGFAGGIYAYASRRLIDYRLGLSLLVVTVPVAIAGSWLSGMADPRLLKAVLGAGLFAVATSFLKGPEEKDLHRMDEAIRKEYGGEKAETCLTASSGERICYTVCNRTEGRILAGTGALFLGMISTGLGELNGYFLLQRCRVPSRISVATSVFVIAVTALFASGGHVARFLKGGGQDFSSVVELIVFAVPGVLLGAQLGPLVASRIPQRIIERLLGGLFILIALLTLGEALLGK